MAHWKDITDYTPFARLIVEYMWEQRPPLLPSQFAAQMGIPKQVISKWLNGQAEPDPRHLLHMAERMHIPVQRLFLAAGYTTPEHPLLSRADAWAEVRQALMDAADITDEDRATVLRVLHILQPISKQNDDVHT
jgi:transcriptional regulator with XRE-family HTH domain